MISWKQLHAQINTPQNLLTKAIRGYQNAEIRRMLNSLLKHPITVEELMFVGVHVHRNVFRVVNLKVLRNLCCNILMRQ